MSKAESFMLQAAAMCLLVCAVVAFVAPEPITGAAPVGLPAGEPSAAVAAPASPAIPRIRRECRRVGTNSTMCKETEI